MTWSEWEKTKPKRFVPMTEQTLFVTCPECGHRIVLWPPPAKPPEPEKPSAKEKP